MILREYQLDLTTEENVLLTRLQVAWGGNLGVTNIFDYCLFLGPNRRLKSPGGCCRKRIAVVQSPT